jgi:L-iditol 2-dehydrogenase
MALGRIRAFHPPGEAFKAASLSLTRWCVRVRAVLKRKPEPGVEFAEIDMPSIQSDEVLVEVRAAAICGSDLGIYDYTPAYSAMRLPVVLGHEFAGRVAEAGSRAEGYAVGDRVVSESVKACGVCPYCRSGRENLCDSSALFGIHADGGFAEYVAVPARLLHGLPDELSFEEGALIEPLSNALHFVREITPVRLGDLVVVQGCGPIGLLSAQLLRLAGAEVLVTGIGVDTVRFGIAARLGFETVNVEEEDLVERVMGATAGRGADVAFVATGAPAAVSQATQIVRKGGRVTIVGIFGRPVEVPVTLVVRRELTLSGAYDARPVDFEDAIGMARRGAVDLGSLITHRFPLERATEAFEAAKSRIGCKVLFVPQAG